MSNEYSPEHKWGIVQNPWSWEFHHPGRSADPYPNLWPNHVRSSPLSACWDGANGHYLKTKITNMHGSLQHFKEPANCSSCCASLSLSGNCSANCSLLIGNFGLYKEPWPFCVLLVRLQIEQSAACHQCTLFLNRCERSWFLIAAYWIHCRQVNSYETNYFLNFFIFWRFMNKILYFGTE